MMNSVLKNFTAPLAATVLVLIVSGCASKPVAEPDRAAAFWPPYPDQPRVQYLTSYQSSNDVAPNKSKFDDLIYGKEQSNEMSLSKPYGIEMYDGKIYICDIRAFDITVLDIRKHQTLVLGKSGPQQLQRPVDIAIADDGMKYVADLGRNVIAVFNQKDQFSGIIAHPDLKPVSVAVYQNELYVCDFKQQRVEVWDRISGTLLRTIGSPGSTDGLFIRPLGIAVDQQGNLYVADVMRCKIQKFDHSGKFVSSFGT